MLVLSRLRDETIMIGDEIEITIVDIRGDKVRLGIAAPTRISVHRKEVYEAIKMENAHAARVVGDELDLLRLPLSVGPQKNKAPGTRATRLLQAASTGHASVPPPRLGAPEKSIIPEAAARRRDGPTLTVVPGQPPGALPDRPIKKHGGLGVPLPKAKSA